MQDEVNEKTMALCIKGGKISAQLLKAALTKLLSEIEKKKQQSKKMGGQNRCKRGKQSIKSLQQSGAQLTNIVVTDNNIKSFDRVARKYGIDYSLKKAEKEGKTEYLVFCLEKDQIFAFPLLFHLFQTVINTIFPGYPVKGLDVIVRDNDVRDLRAALLQALDALLTCSLTLTFSFLLLLFLLVHLCQQLYQGRFQNLCSDFSSFDAQ